jgi:hypothetical protein
MRKSKNVTASTPRPDHLLTVDEAADLLNISKSSLDKWRTWGRGPAFIKVRAPRPLSAR